MDDLKGSVTYVAQYFRRKYGKHAKNLMKTDVHESEAGYEMAIELPGFKKEDIKVDLKDGYLTVSAQKSLDKEEHKGKKILRQERYSGSCSRTFYIGDVKAEDVKGKYDAGILTLEFPKEDQKKIEEKRTIAID